MANSTLQNKLIAALRNISMYCSEDGVLLKNKVVAAAHNLSPNLLRVLLAQPSLKEHFFEEVNGIPVFDKVKFQRFVSNKNFLPDSFTAYKNYIGLSTPDGQDFISESNEVVLTWPYKDCILEGGQQKEDDKREELFYNETLAPEDVTRLTETKALTNFYVYSTSGKDKNPSSLPGNAIIKGNNLLVLHSLLPIYRESIKAIYIDPPYNIGGDSFLYNDRFKHSTWLTFTKNRLEIARELLRKDGAIFVHIDHHELAYLSVLMDEVFGSENKVQIIAVKTASPAGFKTVNPGPIDVTEYILFYTKDKANFDFRKGYVPVGYNKNYNKYVTFADDVRDWTFEPIKDAMLRSLGFSSESEAKKKFGSSLWSIIREGLITKFAYDNADRIVSVRDPHKPTEQVKALMKLSKKCGHVVEQVRTDGSKAYFYQGGALAFYSDKMQNIDGEMVITELLTDFWNHISWAGIANEGGVTLKNGKKPEKLIKQILELSTNPGDIVLDYHLGSGTTAAVAMKMGRRFIGIEQLDYGSNDSAIRLQHVVDGDRTGISKAVNWRGGGSFVYCELAKANAKYIDKIQAAETDDDLALIWDKMKESSMLTYKIKINDIDTQNKDFSALSFEDKKRFLIACLDKNMLYVPFSDMDSEEYAINEKDKKLTELFYSKR